VTDTTFVYVTYIATTPEKLWEALTSSEFTKKYWFGKQVQSDWQEGSTVTFLNEDGKVTDQGKVLKCELYRLLAFSFQRVEDVRERSPKVTYVLEPMESTVKLTVKHEDLLATDINDGTVHPVGVNIGWPAILSGLKSLLETGQALQMEGWLETN
jgi:uncharacterized protein YndB with AHSA1/START domain